MNARRVSLALQFLAHSALAGYVTVALAGLLELLLGLLTGSDRSLDFYFWGPTFLAPGLIGLARRFFRRATLASSLVMVCFSDSLILGIWELVTWIRLEPHGNEIAGLLRDNFLGTRCGASECLEELLITAPLIASIAYAMGAEFGDFAWLDLDPPAHR